MTVSVTYLIVSIVLLACSYLNLSKNSSLNTFFSKADAKVRTIFELPKLFRSFFSKSFFESGRFKFLFLCSVFQLICVSLSKAGAKVLLYGICSKSSQLFFCRYFAVVHVSRWFSKDAIEYVFKTTKTEKTIARTLYIVYKF